jgi:hypothetical protein
MLKGKRFSDGSKIKMDENFGLMKKEKAFD